MILSDAFGRRINYLRISVTDRCNFRCAYCMPKDGMRKFARKDILSFEEIERIVSVGAKLGIERVRITGGEPLVRKGLPDFISRVNTIRGIKEITLTTNGALLAQYADELKRAGLKRINISLDTLNPGKFAFVTRGGVLQNVLDGIRAAADAGLAPIKLNVVLMRGVNDDEIEQLAGFTALGYHVRFIELMPLEHNALWREQFLPAEIAKKRLEEIKPLVPWKTQTGAGPGPAADFQWGRNPGRIGFITALSCSFCGNCNRLRLSADGKLYPCLFSGEYIDMKAVMRENENNDGVIENGFYQACEKKPKEHGASPFFAQTTPPPMAKIGG